MVQKPHRSGLRSKLEVGKWRWSVVDNSWAVSSYKKKCFLSISSPFPYVCLSLGFLPLSSTWKRWLKTEWTAKILGNQKAWVPASASPVISGGSWASAFSSLNLRAFSQQWKHWAACYAKVLSFWTSVHLSSNVLCMEIPRHPQESCRDLDFIHHWANIIIFKN